MRSALDHHLQPDESVQFRIFPSWLNMSFLSCGTVLVPLVVMAAIPLILGVDASTEKKIWIHVFVLPLILFALVWRKIPRNEVVVTDRRVLSLTPVWNLEIVELSLSEIQEVRLCPEIGDSSVLAVAGSQPTTVWRGRGAKRLYEFLKSRLAPGRAQVGPGTELKSERRVERAAATAYSIHLWGAVVSPSLVGGVGLVYIGQDYLGIGFLFVFLMPLSIFVGGIAAWITGLLVARRMVGREDHDALLRSFHRIMFGNSIPGSRWGRKIAHAIARLVFGSEPIQTSE